MMHVALEEVIEQPMDSPEMLGPVLDLSDPLDAILNEYTRQVSADALPLGKEQRTLIKGTQRRDLSATDSLVETHEGLVAAVGYQYKGFGIDSVDLLAIGRRELVRTALKHDFNGKDNFNDQAIIDMEGAFESAIFGSPVTDTKQQSTTHPMDRILHFVQDLQHINTTAPASPEDMATTPLAEKLAHHLSIMKRSRAADQVAQLQPAGRAVLPYLHLPTQQIAQSQNLEPNPLGKVIERVRADFGAPSRLGAALVALEAGVEFINIQPAPPMDELTIVQRQIAVRALQSNEAIAAELGITESKLEHDMSALYSITKARTRTELGVMAHTYDFEPSTEELAVIPDALRGFAPVQQKVLSRLHLPYITIAEEAETSKESVNGAVANCRKIMEADNNVEMALRLRDQGVKYDIPTPKCDISTLLIAKETKILESLVYSTDKAIAEATGIPMDRVGVVVTHSLRKTGARTRVELALMMAEFDTGERRQPDTRTRKQILAEKLGQKTLDDVDIEAYVKRLGSKQQRQAMSFYLTEESDDEKPPTWKELNAKYKIRSASSTASVGIRRIQAMMEADARAKKA
jgi:DNA-binding NarL/FixJ family response regulator